MTSRPVFRITASGTWRANIRRFGGITESDRGAQSYKDRFEMPLTCAVLGCSNRGNREEGKRYFRIPIEVSHKDAKIQKITKKTARGMAEKLESFFEWRSIRQRSRICSDHFVKRL